MYEILSGDHCNQPASYRIGFLVHETWEERQQERQQGRQQEVRSVNEKKDANEGTAQRKRLLIIHGIGIFDHHTIMYHEC